MNIIKKIDIKNKKELVKWIFINKYKKGPSVFFYINVGSFSFGKQFLNILSQADHVYPNSFYLNKLSGFLYKKSLEKINAEDFFYEACKIAQKKGKSIFLLGSTPGASKKAFVILKKIYPRLKIYGYHGYFKDDDEALKRINRFSPDIIFVGLGSGYQELWVIKNKNKLKNVRVIVTIGNFIDILGGIKHLPSNFFKKNQLEWLYRLVVEPKRLSSRYFFGLINLLREVTLSERPRSSRS